MYPFDVTFNSSPKPSSTHAEFNEADEALRRFYEEHTRPSSIRFPLCIEKPVTVDDENVCSGKHRSIPELLPSMCSKASVSSEPVATRIDCDTQTHRNSMPKTQIIRYADLVEQCTKMSAGRSSVITTNSLNLAGRHSRAQDTLHKTPVTEHDIFMLESTSSPDKYLLPCDLPIHVNVGDNTGIQYVIDASGESGLPGAPGRHGEPGVRGVDGQHSTDYPESRDGLPGGHGTRGTDGFPGSRGGNGATLYVDLRWLRPDENGHSEQLTCMGRSNAALFVNGVHCFTISINSTSKSDDQQICQPPILIFAPGGPGGDGGQGGNGGIGGEGGKGVATYCSMLRTSFIQTNSHRPCTYVPGRERESAYSLITEAAIDLLQGSRYGGHSQRYSRNERAGVFREPPVSDNILASSFISFMADKLEGPNAFLKRTRPKSSSRQRFFYAGDGGPGGQGGDGGRGGDAGDGGDGGVVTVTVDDPRLLMSIECNVSGGHPGSAAEGGAGGNGGIGGRPGKSSLEGLAGDLEKVGEICPAMDLGISAISIEFRNPFSPQVRSRYMTVQNSVPESHLGTYTYTHLSSNTGDVCENSEYIGSLTTSGLQSSKNERNSLVCQFDSEEDDLYVPVSQLKSTTQLTLIPGAWGRNGPAGTAGERGAAGLRGKMGTITFRVTNSEFESESSQRSSTNSSDSRSEQELDSDRQYYLGTGYSSAPLQPSTYPTYLKRFQVKVLDFDVLGMDGDGFLKPNEDISITDIQLINQSSMPLPSGARFSDSRSEQELDSDRQYYLGTGYSSAPLQPSTYPTYLKRFQVKVLDFDVLGMDGDGFLKPNEDISITDIQLINQSSMPLPSGARLSFSSTDTVFMFTDQSVQLTALAPNEQVTLKETFCGRIQLEDSPQKPGEFNGLASIVACVSLCGIKFTQGCHEKKIPVRYPLRLCSVSSPKTTAFREEFQISFNIENLSRKPFYGSDMSDVDESNRVDIVLRVCREMRVVRSSSGDSNTMKLISLSEQIFGRSFNSPPQVDIHDSANLNFGVIPEATFFDNGTSIPGRLEVTVCCEVEKNVGVFTKLPFQLELYLAGKLIQYEQGCIRCVHRSTKAGTAFPTMFRFLQSKSETSRLNQMGKHTVHHPPESVSSNTAVLIIDEAMSEKEFAVWHSLLRSVGLGNFQIWDSEENQSTPINLSHHCRNQLIICPRYTPQKVELKDLVEQHTTNTPATECKQREPYDDSALLITIGVFDRHKYPGSACDSCSPLVYLLGPLSNLEKCWSDCSEMVTQISRSANARKFEIMGEQQNMGKCSGNPKNCVDQEYSRHIHPTIFVAQAYDEYGLPFMECCSGDQFRKPKDLNGKGSIDETRNVQPLELPEIVPLLSPWSQMFLVLLSLLSTRNRSSLLAQSPSKPVFCLPWGEQLSTSYLAALSLQPYLENDFISWPEECKPKCSRFEILCADIRESPERYFEQLSVSWTVLMKYQKRFAQHGDQGLRRRVETVYKQTTKELRNSLRKEEYQRAKKEALRRLKYPKSFLNFKQLLHPCIGFFPSRLNLFNLFEQLSSYQFNDAEIWQQLCIRAFSPTTH
ncbi:hypothetical protein T265_11598 [Opisthorchis viverrini]|uniref:DUF7932 domain-containing protein n=1 Tax=Opisthorchis viverrini TaxID=6198 RepID=A0A074ZX17_OPIVI|nr:hypothetical protein T265_11598 [Opisthorchis viverrini]KER19694.1 hypothetical protein T265_11598 [Opisthorchis viverrini]